MILGPDGEPVPAEWAIPPKTIMMQQEAWEQNRFHEDGRVERILVHTWWYDDDEGHTHYTRSVKSLGFYPTEEHW